MGAQVPSDILGPKLTGQLFGHCPRASTQASLIPVRLRLGSEGGQRHSNLVQQLSRDALSLLGLTEWYERTEGELKGETE